MVHRRHDPQQCEHAERECPDQPGPPGGPDRARPGQEGQQQGGRAGQHDGGQAEHRPEPAEPVPSEAQQHLIGEPTTGLGAHCDRNRPAADQHGCDHRPRGTAVAEAGLRRLTLHPRTLRLRRRVSTRPSGSGASKIRADLGQFPSGDDGNCPRSPIGRPRSGGGTCRLVRSGWARCGAGGECRHGGSTVTVDGCATPMSPDPSPVSSHRSAVRPTCVDCVPSASTCWSSGAG
ncbi:hypothetical protein ONO86_03078 [Micromonospora noduli]|nr:hypothetical protein ONO86_03078 [Micromonospora noduli]